MGKSVPTIAPAQLQHHLKRTSSHLIKTPKPLSPNPSISPVKPLIGGGGESESPRLKKKKKMEEDSSSNSEKRSYSTPLSQVVSDCVKRWFQDTHKEAKAGDLSMQVLLAQMYYCGYGVPRDSYKGKVWMTRASRVRTSVWKVSNKRPGYNASDSDSDELVSDS